MNKPRNHVVVALLQRKSGSGAHVKSQKAQRQRNRQQLLKELKEVKMKNFWSLFLWEAICSFSFRCKLRYA